jgi:hypothetical protein
MKAPYVISNDQDVRLARPLIKWEVIIAHSSSEISKPARNIDNSSYVQTSFKPEGVLISHIL